MTESSFPNAGARRTRNKLRLAYFVSHPIQYQSPLLRKIAQEPDIDLTVFFSSDISVRSNGYTDQEFKIRVKWDTPLLDGFKYEFLPAIYGRDGIAFAKPINVGIMRRLRVGHFDAVWLHGYNTLTNLQAMSAAHCLNIPVLMRAESTLHDRPRSGIKLAFKRLFFTFLRSNVSAILTIGTANNLYWKHYLDSRIPLFPCYYAVDNDYFQSSCSTASECRENFRRFLGLEAGRPVILFAAKLIRRKRCIDLLNAFLQLSITTALFPTPYLLIVGDGEERAALELVATQAHSIDVRFLGFRNQSELPQLYDLCDVFVLPSVDEPWGLAVNEVMNAGRAVIVSDEVGCQKDLVHHNVNGRVIRARNVHSLAESLRIVLECEQMRRDMGAQSLRIIQDFSFGQNIAGIRQALQVLVPGFSARCSQ
jgi:glycosyltransferase involved in cell wall biosynthesis